MRCILGRGSSIAAVALALASSTPTLAGAGKLCPERTTLRFDLGSGSVSTDAPCVRHGGSVTVIVERVNPFLYAVEINGQSFRSNTDFPQELAGLWAPDLPVVAGGTAFDHAVRSYAAGVNELYTAADELPRRLLWVVHGVATPDAAHLGEDALRVVRAHVPIPADDLRTVSNEVLRFGHDSLLAVEEAYRAAAAAYPTPPSASARAAFEIVEVSLAKIVADRGTLRERFQIASDLLLAIDAARLEVISAPIVATGEVLSVRLSVTLRSDLSLDRYPVTFEMQDREVARVRVARGFNVGASAGLAFSSPVDASYVTVPDGTGDETVERKGDESAFFTSLAVLMHVYQRKLGDVNHAISVGGGLNQGGGAQVFLGYGAMLGGRRRVLISAGGTGSQVERLSGGLQVGDVVPPGTGLSTRDETVLGFFVGATYQFWAGGGRP